MKKKNIYLHKQILFETHVELHSNKDSNRPQNCCQKKKLSKKKKCRKKMNILNDKKTLFSLVEWKRVRLKVSFF